MKIKKYSKKLKIPNLVTLSIFLFHQIVWPAPEIPITFQSAEESFQEKQIPENLSQISIPSFILQTTNQFLDDTLTLTPADDTDDIEAENAPLNYEVERHDFEEAVDLLSPEYASAVIVKSLSEENIKSLLSLSFETAVIVLHGEIVLFSTGGKEEIGISGPAKALLEKANFISHTHVAPGEENGPSLYDLENAVSAPGQENVLSRKGVFAYNQGGILNDSNPY